MIHFTLQLQQKETKMKIEMPKYLPTPDQKYVILQPYLVQRKDDAEEILTVIVAPDNVLFFHKSGVITWGDKDYLLSHYTKLRPYAKGEVLAIQQD